MEDYSYFWSHVQHLLLEGVYFAIFRVFGGSQFCNLNKVLRFRELSYRETKTRSACRYARPTGQRPVELTKGKWNDIVR